MKVMSILNKFPARKVRQDGQEVRQLTSHSQIHETSNQRAASHSNKPIETSKDRVTTKQGTKKAEQV